MSVNIKNLFVKFVSGHLAVPALVYFDHPSVGRAFHLVNNKISPSRPSYVTGVDDLYLLSLDAIERLKQSMCGSYNITSTN